MTVEELIRKFGEFPADARMVVQGYEDGYDEVSAMKEVRVALNTDSEWYNGSYDDAGNAGGEPAVLIFSKDRLEGHSRA